MLAKISSDLNKPNGQSYLRPDRQEILDFMTRLPLRKVPHIGGMKETCLNAMGITTCQELRDRACDIMIAFTEHESSFLIRCSLGLGQTHHEQDSEDDEQKGISVSETFKALKTKEQFL